MVTLQLKTQIPDNRHLTIQLDLPDIIQPGEAEIVLIFNTIKNDTKLQKGNQQLQEKLLKFSVWSEEDIAGFKTFREESNKWKPDEF